MSTRYLTRDDEERRQGLDAAANAVGEGGLVVLPTDTVYGLGADAFTPDAVRRLLEAKGRERSMPPPVLVPSLPTLEALVDRLPGYARSLVEALWPGPLTVVCREQGSLQWDLGDTRGTVAVRMPDCQVALELLSRTGPMAVSSANLTGSPPAVTVEEAQEMLGEDVEVYLDDGPSPGGEPSTIVDATSDTGRVLRTGALTADQLNDAIGDSGPPVLEPE